MTTTQAPATDPLPVGFAVRMDDSAHEVEPGVWFGGQPARVLRVTDAGRAAWQELQEGPVRTPAAGRLARRLTDAGLAHPIPPPASAALDLTVVVPVHDRADLLDRCLVGLGGGFPVIVVDDASRDGGAVARVAERRGARLLRRDCNGGPAAARNTGVAAVETDLVLFIDSDTLPEGDWIPQLAAHLQDPLVVAVAPRIRPLADVGWSGRFANAHCPLDLGDRRASVRPYEPAVTVRHVEPRGWGPLLARRFRYGTSSAALAHRHPGNVAPLIVQPWFALATAGALALRPVVAAAGFAGCLLETRRALHRAGLPARGLVRPTLNGVLQTWVGFGRYATQFAAPAVLGALVTGGRRRRFAAAGLLLGSAVSGWWRSDRSLDPARYAAGSVLDDLAYGAGVLAGCARQRTVRPLLPKTIIRSPRW